MTSPHTQAHNGRAPRAMQNLNLNGPIRAGLAAITLGALMIAGTVFVELDAGPVTSAVGIVRAEPVVVRHVDGGTIGRVHIAADADVIAGQLLISLDTRLLDSQIAGLRTQADANRMRISGLRQEADALAAAAPQSTQRARLAGLEAQMADIEQEGLGLKVRIAMAEQELKRTDIRAPVAGRVVGTLAAGGTHIKANGVALTLRPAVDRMVLETTWPTHIQPAAGQAARVWLNAQPLAQALAGQVEAISTVEDTQTRSLHKTRIGVDISGTHLASAAGQAEHRFKVQLVTGKTSLLATLFAPFTRDIASNPIRTRAQ